MYCRNFFFLLDVTVVWWAVGTVAQSQLCQETIAVGCDSYQQIETDETVCGTDGSHYNNFCEFSVAKCKDPTLEIASLGHCGGGQTTTTRPTTTTQKTTTMTTTSTTTTTTSPTTLSTRPSTTKSTTLDPNQQLFCDNKDFITCPSTVSHVCGSDGVIYKNDCEFAKAKCSDGTLSIQSMSYCHHPTSTSKPTTLDANQQLFCDNKDFISCPSTTKHVCGSNGVLYNNDCEFAKAKCTNGGLTIQPSSFCHHAY